MKSSEIVFDDLRDRVLFLTCIDPWDSPTGGQGTFARHMLKAFPDKLVVAGMTRRRFAAGRMLSRVWEDTHIPFMSLGRVQETRHMGLVPRRIKVYLLAKRGLRWIRNTGIRLAFMQTPEIVLATCREDWLGSCYRSAGVENPVSNSRYAGLRFLGPLYERNYFKALRRLSPDIILASASWPAIERMKERSSDFLKNMTIRQFPTRVDTEIFHPQDKAACRSALGIDQHSTVFCTCGRISWVKGWRLLLEAFRMFREHNPSSKLYFVGSGEDSAELSRSLSVMQLKDSVFVSGFVDQHRVALYLNAADVCVVGSVIEGWSLAMLEMVACAKPIVSTEVSGTETMIFPGQNGFILRDRDPEGFSIAMADALTLENSAAISLPIADKLSVQNLRNELAALWPPIA